MREPVDKERIEAFMAAIGSRVHGSGRIYLTGGATALLHGWRLSTIDIDVKPDPEPEGFFEAVAELKESLSMNVELASPDQFLPELPGWRSRSRFIDRFGSVDFYHYDLYSQALSKIERGHDRDRHDVVAMVDRDLIDQTRLWDLFVEIAPDLVRFPSIDGATLRMNVGEFCGRVD